MKKLAAIQANLNAPKNQFNKFGGYSYRSCEDILKAVKPLLDGAILTLNDSIEEVAGRVYVMATATITDGEQSVSTTAFAREPLTKRGMDESQTTVAASSYARKHALNGLFAIDDNKDTDAQAQQETKEPSTAPAKEQYSDVNFKLNFPQWKSAINSGKRSPDQIISMIETKGILSEAQKKSIYSIK